ncbi:sensor histidine kinase [Rhizobium sp. S152]|uniref:sensor histidine kinase n=1 Tax=Rhizobium sp. S152 TaxID=3055038 RepID=UPI0025A95CE0|nr:sensor histidine kinase [Rhizobium sp. S152]MDM9625332.1 sensor histidine kinase [Rhizobium sp. S152]
MRIDRTFPGTLRLRFSLAQQFIVAGAIVLVIGMVLIGLWVTTRIEDAAVRNSAAATALYVDGIIAPLTQEMASGAALSESAQQLLKETLQRGALRSRLFSFKLWRPDGTVIFSTEQTLVGRKFRVGTGLTTALAGGIHARFDDLHADENKLERDSRQTLLEIYSPIREAWSGDVIGVAEFYERADDLSAELRSARLQSWLVVASVTAGMLVLLFVIVARGSQIIATQRHSLDRQVAELSRMLSLNDALRARADKANQRTATLNERYLRRISAELHDGPTQLLGFAALRLEAISKGRARDDDALQVKQSIAEAIKDIRDICRGLTLPELKPLAGHEVARRAIQTHQTHSKSSVEAEIGEIAVSSQAAKICIYRFIQETLSNAARHAKASDISVKVRELGGMIEVSVHDNGMGFQVKPGDFGLGLAGIEERVAGLGGQFQLISDTAGTTVRMTIPSGAESEDL